jgi:hypothetical protein
MPFDDIAIRMIFAEREHAYRALAEHQERLARLGPQPSGWDRLRRGVVALITGVRGFANAAEVGTRLGRAESLGSVVPGQREQSAAHGD